MTQLAELLHSGSEPPLACSWKSIDDYILALTFIYMGMELSPATMPETSGDLWAWALAWVDVLRDKDDSTTIAACIQYIQDVQSRRFLPEGRFYLHTTFDKELIF